MTFGSTSNPFGSLLVLAERERKDKAMEDSLARSERPASDSEEDTIQRAARMVRAALAGNAWLGAEGVVVEPQGSYHNNTNVRQSADMDLRVVHPSLVILPPPGVDRAVVDQLLDYRDTGWTNGQLAGELRRQVELSLVAQFGRSNVVPGNRALKVKEVTGSRTDIDVVPALTLHRAHSVQPSLLYPLGLARTEGIWILGRGGDETTNFPEQHRQNGIAKRARTSYRFKKVVRCLKSMRDQFVAHGLLGAKCQSASDRDP